MIAHGGLGHDSHNNTGEEPAVSCCCCGCFEAVQDGLEYPDKDRSLGEQGLFDSLPLLVNTLLYKELSEGRTWGQKKSILVNI